jgi:hypothetical protein
VKSDSSNRVLRNLFPFAAALGGYDEAERVGREAPAQGKTIAELQVLMASSELPAEELVIYFEDRT